MKGTFGQFLRDAWLPVCGSIALGTLLVGCGDKTDPKAVGLDELKFANGAKVMDLGNGSVKLMWNGMNNEEKFEGYNIYGAKDTDGALSKLEGQTIKLLDDKGEPDAAGKATLQKMNYNGKDWETAGAASDAAGDLQVVPYWKNGTAEDPVLPSCRPGAADTTGMAQCAVLAAEGTTGDFNGIAWFQIDGLKVGTTYCFTVLAAMDSGKSVAQTTSEVRCVTPKSMVKSTGLKPTADSNKATNTLDIETVRTACGTTGGTACGELKAVEADVTAANDQNCGNGNKDATAKSTTVLQEVCVDSFSGQTLFTAGQFSGVQDLGYYTNGFADMMLPTAPALSAFGTVQNKEGYSVAGQSVPLEDKHIYVIAHGQNKDTKSFMYDYVYVTFSADKTSFDAEWRLSNKADAR